METTSLVNLAADKKISDFSELVKDILTTKAQDAIKTISESLGEEDDIDPALLDDSDDIDDEDLTEEQLQWISDNISEEEFAALDEESKANLTAFREAQKTNG